MSKWLILDCNYLCYRSFYSMGSLSHKEIPTGVVFGFFRDVFTFEEFFQTDKIIFSWDFGLSFRQSIYPRYKNNREKPAEEQRLIKLVLKRQMRELRTHIIKEAGFPNVFYREGYESDDIMAYLSTILKGEVIIVTADEDLFQCISPTVSVYNPRKGQVKTLQWFYKTYGITPRRWANVKAIAGCTSDNVEGIHGVGETKAVQYLKGEMNPLTQTYKNISKRMSRVRRNLQLVKLPWPGLEEIITLGMISSEKRDPSLWKKVAEEYGIKTLASAGGVRRGKIHQKEKKTKGRKGFGV